MRVSGGAKYVREAKVTAIGGGSAEILKNLAAKQPGI